MINYNKNTDNNKGSDNKCGHRPDSPSFSTPPENPAQRDSALAAFVEKICDFFAPSPDLVFSAGIIERQTRRREHCLALAEHLAQPDGTLSLVNVNLGKIAKTLNLKYRHARQALRDLLEIGGFERQKRLLFGNRCGHNPDAPRHFTPPASHKQHPLLLRRAIEAVCRYYVDPSILPALNAVNGSTRRQRSERREACVTLLCCLLHYTDLVTLRVGIPQLDGSMKGLTLTYLAKLAGLDERRAERAIKDLKAAGIITVHALCAKLEDALYKGFAAIRVVSKHLFEALGFGQWLRHEREKAAARQKKKDAKREAKQQANVNMAKHAQRGRKPAGKAETAEPAASSTARRGEMSPASAFLGIARKILNGGADPPD